MATVARVFGSEGKAREAAKLLEEAGYDPGVILVFAAAAPAAPAAEGDEAPAAPSSAAPSAEELIEKVSAVGEMDVTTAMRCSRAIAAGKSLVVVGDLVGYLQLAEQVMDGAGAEPAAALEAGKPNNPSPFSDFIGFPCLEDRLSFFSGDNPLKDSNWTLFPVELKDKLTFNVNLINDPAPLSSKLGFKPLSADKPWRTSFGFKLLSDQQD
jgi:hypothetical protein